MPNNAREHFANNLYYDRTFDCDAAKILPGEYYCTFKDMLIVTVLGSCVSACIRDRVSGIGGMNHFMLPDGGDVSNPLISAQTGQVRIRGAELEVITRVTPDLDLIGAYAYVNAIVESGDNAGKRVDTVPEHQASLWAKYRLTALRLPGVTVGGGVRYIGESWDGTDTIRTPDYTLFDAMIRYETGPWRLQVNASNLADKRHVTTCLARGDCFYGIGRTVLGSATYRF